SLTYLDAVAKKEDGSSKYKLIVFDDATEEKSLTDKQEFWKSVKKLSDDNKELITVIVTSDFDEVQSIINKVVIVKNNGETVNKLISEFVGKKSLKERVINEFTN
ncbi:MAG: hypothetical protein LBB07_02955, partial [Bifidobacteriaceae bacterium]|nr:hypothetical protein [Bifidobacteriaceae bacterium]